MMKKNKYIIALLLLSNLFTGCEIGFLDNEAFSDLTREGYYEKLSDYENDKMIFRDSSLNQS